jgi:stalled ribosome rescue protein Dom34
MKKQMGLWIDHRRAVIVTVSDNGTMLKEILSHAEKQPRRTGDSPLKGSYEAQHVPPDGSRHRAFKKELNTYYDQVIESLREAETILLFGPGVAKTELKALLDKARFGERILALETADKMSDTEITKKVPSMALC